MQELPRAVGIGTVRPDTKPRKFVELTECHKLARFRTRNRTTAPFSSCVACTQGWLEHADTSSKYLPTRVMAGLSSVRVCAVACDKQHSVRLPCHILPPCQLPCQPVSLALDSLTPP